MSGHRVASPIIETWNAFEDAFDSGEYSKYSSFLSYPDSASRAYMWGWYWFLCGHDNLKELFNKKPSSIKGSMIEMGFIEAREYYTCKDDWK